MLVLKVGPMCIAYSFLSCKLPTSFSVFLTLILLGKNDKSLWSSCSFSGYWRSTSKKYLTSQSSV